MTIIDLASDLDTISGKIESVMDLLMLLHEGLFEDVLDEDWKRQVFCNRLHYYDALLMTTTEAITQTEREVRGLSDALYVIDRVRRQSEQEGEQVAVVCREAVAV